ncbi:hypothetical protein V6N13_036847 [Hibiscus sabdariffa]|uniref:Uncharacterized protein n=1 Tax=Hibiscus sabdariffa TaxID=183260 RepID=A0ABR1ZH23_9ROSI
MMEQRLSVWRKEKLAESGKPDLKMPLSTMEKFNGGIKLGSSEKLSGTTTFNDMSTWRSTTATASRVLHIWLLSAGCWFRLGLVLRQSSFMNEKKGFLLRMILNWTAAARWRRGGGSYKS